jgi:peptide/nickel transport system permease protein
MINYAIRRLLALIPTLFGVTVVVFMFIHLIPGDPATAMLREGAPQELADRIREQLGLNRPLWQQYMVFMIGNDGMYNLEKFFVGDKAHPPTTANVTYGVLRGDLGTSLVTKNKISDDLRHKFGATAELTITAMFVALMVGIPAGLIAGAKQNTPIDTASMVGSLIGVSMPIYWLGLMALFLFAATLHWAPSGTRLSNDIKIDSITNLYLLDSLLTANWAGFLDAFKHIIIPAVVLATVPMSILARMTRAAMLEVLNQDYIRTARAKGVQQFQVIMKHAFRNALIPIVTIAGLQVGFLLSGAILTESIFAWPGLGRWVYEAIQLRDYPVVQGVTLVIATVFALINLWVDLLYGMLDPRISYQ